jgi:radical SAM superfamily enzyme YgiQ (UPF0313 family)
MVCPLNHRRVLLVYGNCERKPWPTMPIGLCYVASALKSRGHLVKVVDLMFVKDTSRVLQGAIQDFQPEMIGVSVRNIDSADWYGQAKYLEIIRDEIIKPARSVAKVPIIIGGPAVNIAPRQITEYLDADCAVYGDGERACVDLVEKWKEGTDNKPAVSHVVWNEKRWGAVTKDAKDSGAVVPGRIGDLGSIEFPRINEWIDLRPYLRASSPYPIQTKRGCAFDCSYCVYGQIEGKAYRQRDPEAIAQEIEELSQKARIWRFEFTDSVFNHPAGHAEAVCRAIIDRKIKASFTTTGVNPASFSLELLELMSRAGFEDYSFAPDSASKRVLKRLGKGYTSPDVLVRAAEVVRSAKLPMMWWFSFGLPEEDGESVEETLEFVRRYVRKRDLVVCSVGMRIYPGTRLERIAREEGQLKPGEDLLASKFYEPRAISLPEIQERLQREARQMPNILLSSEVNSYMMIIKLGNMLKQTFKIHQPLWRAAPLVNRIKHGLLNFR